MLRNGYDRDFSERCFRQIEGFADYGFPESHAASFALLVYVSSWLKLHYPAVFACALLNSQPMGFYAPAQIVRDARDHGVEVRPVDVNRSAWDCTLEKAADERTPGGGWALRLGFRQIKGFQESEGESIAEDRRDAYVSVQDLQERTRLGKGALEKLARADAFGSLKLDRRQALWRIRGMDDGALPLFAAAGIATNSRETPVRLPVMGLGENVAEDYRTLRLSLKAHPLALLRAGLIEGDYVPCRVLETMRNGNTVRVAGLVTARQRPGSAKGVVFVTLEDETAVANLVVWGDIFEKHRRQVLSAHVLGVEGRVQKEGKVIHVVSERLFDLTPLLATLEHQPGPARSDPLPLQSRDFH